MRGDTPFGRLAPPGRPPIALVHATAQGLATCRRRSPPEPPSLVLRLASRRRRRDFNRVVESVVQPAVWPRRALSRHALAPGRGVTSSIRGTRDGGVRGRSTAGELLRALGTARCRPARRCNCVKPMRCQRLHRRIVRTPRCVMRKKDRGASVLAELALDRVRDISDLRTAPQSSRRRAPAVPRSMSVIRQRERHQARLDARLDYWKLAPRRGLRAPRSRRRRRASRCPGVDAVRAGVRARGGRAFAIESSARDRRRPRRLRGRPPARAARRADELARRLTALRRARARRSQIPARTRCTSASACSCGATRPASRGARRCGCSRSSSSGATAGRCASSRARSSRRSTMRSGTRWSAITSSCSIAGSISRRCSTRSMVPPSRARGGRSSAVRALGGVLARAARARSRSGRARRGRAPRAR